MENLPPSVLVLLVTTLGGLVWFFLRKKDSDQEKQIALLFQKHDEDVERLRVLELKIAIEHYRKSDLDPKFEKLESAIKEMSAMLGAKFDALSSALLAHIAKEDKDKV